MRRLLSKCVIIFGGILTSSTLTNPFVEIPRSKFVPQETPQEDPRLARLIEFFNAAGSPLTAVAQEFLAAADRYHLDWRLLPSISLVESGGGKNCKGNNIFGWGAGEWVFSSIRDGINTVADRLANSKLYKDKDLPAVLETYNGNAEYADLVQSVMRRVDPSEPVPADGPIPDYSSKRTPK